MKERDLIFNKYNGKCAYCGCDLVKGWHVDHLKPVRRIKEYCEIKRDWIYRGDMMFKKDDTIENKMPACASCNINKHSLSLEEFRKLISGFMTHLNERNTQYKIAKRYGLASETSKQIKFYFETVNP
jgi:5-methylcytosine-specific restriction endonuclease McrA